MPPDRLVLGLDTSAAHCAAALICGNTVVAARLEEMARGQAERLFPLLEEVLAEAGHSWRDLDGVGCGVGPGNFTGIRLSVSAARGLALSLGVPAVGVSAFDALSEGLDGPVLTSVDARRNEVYLNYRNPAGATETGISPITDIPSRFRDPMAKCVGHASAEIAASIGANAVRPQYPTATAIARVALRRLDQPAERPAPLYIKSADAAPSKDTAPVMLS